LNCSLSPPLWGLNKATDNDAVVVVAVVVVVVVIIDLVVIIIGIDSILTRFYFLQQLSIHF